MKAIVDIFAHSLCCFRKSVDFQDILNVQLFLWRQEYFCYNMQIGKDFRGNVGSRNICPLSFPISLSDMDNVQHRKAHI